MPNTASTTSQKKLYKKKYRISAVLGLYSWESQIQLRAGIAKACQIGHNTLSDWERIQEGQNRSIPADQLQKVAEVLSVDINELLPAPTISVDEILEAARKNAAKKVLKKKQKA